MEFTWRWTGQWNVSGGVTAQRQPRLWEMADTLFNVHPGVLEEWHYKNFYSSAETYLQITARYFRSCALWHQLRLAIALERFHLAHGVFPETLDVLPPEFMVELLPDPWSTQPMKYRRLETDSYLLYSLGANREDDGGTIDPSQRDIVWLYAPP